MTKNLNYLIKLTYDKAYRGYVADVVNLYGCMSQGKTKREALENAKKAIKAYMEVIQKSSRDKAVVEEIVNVPVSVASV
ncbi:MAG: type II toxin-antitoxin system HicB family antitoxin [Candidatus Blackburnbacteria bacterium]|nr:type II toxin-antitoxin system HicB family antitoxin [Candidatus Blackburnbacteria bacterium]